MLRKVGDSKTRRVHPSRTCLFTLTGFQMVLPSICLSDVTFVKFDPLPQWKILQCDLFYHPWPNPVHCFKTGCGVQFRHRFKKECLNMASSWPPDEFVCPVCLEVLRDPATLPCGHTYCLLCIQKHWDKGAYKNVFSCPQCRQTFNPRPSLSRSTVLAEALEKLRLRSQQQDPSSPVYVTVLPDLPTSQDGSDKGLYPQLPVSSPRLCPDHQQPLDLYCRDHKVFVCEECGLYNHKGHQVVRPHEERREKQVSRWG